MTEMATAMAARPSVFTAETVSGIVMTQWTDPNMHMNTYTHKHIHIHIHIHTFTYTCTYT